ncbi:MAG: 16S rRNA (adenine(1518)-N(6)/adenine(1519)-N(6))-dimethyltransferase RsmA [Kiritimatiellae bacterium]|nr:16S rRNA (adenine(1518)-N(6)/adenine(1519)-N(6))-dimethyltransferase RsmA [Kiritimatiellia bacterium]
MNLTRPVEVRGLLAKLGVCPSQSLGQNFLVDRNIAEIIIRAATLDKRDVVLEIGAGLGVLTERMANVAARVIAVEKDRRLASYLSERFGNQGPVEVTCGDILELGISRLLKEGVTKVVSNLPYSVAGRILVDLSLTDEPPSSLVITVQREVAERILAPPGDSRRSLLSVWIQKGYDVRRIWSVSRTCFWPIPKVASEILLLHKRPATDGNVAVQEMFLKITRLAFQHRRKQMARILASHFDDRAGTRDQAEALLLGLGIDPNHRPQDLTLSQWLTLSRVVQQEIGQVGAKILTRTRVESK